MEKKLTNLEATPKQDSSGEKRFEAAHAPLRLKSTNKFNRISAVVFLRASSVE